jgi:Sulfotransferase domain
VSAPPRRGPKAPDFIGIGAQRAGTSWMYACLYEHPRICMPRKEINFFSREPNWSRGFGWYEEIFAECRPDAVSGEFSTSYLTAPDAPARIRDRYPQVRLVVSLRNPVDRAYSSYLNDIVAGVVPRDRGFQEALEEHPEYLDVGGYASHLRRYLELFPREQLLVSIFEDSRRNPLGAIQEVYRFLGVDAGFRPSMVNRRVGTGRVPRFQWAERSLLRSAAALRRRRRLRPLWWTAKRLGAGDLIRALNTAQATQTTDGLDPEERQSLSRRLEPEISALEELLHVELPGWRR